MEISISRFSNFFVAEDFNLHIKDDSSVIGDFNSSLCAPCPFISNHCIIKTVLDISKGNIISKTVVYRNKKNKDLNNYSCANNEIELEQQSVETFVENYESKILEVLNQYAPLKENTIVFRPPKLWFREEYVNAINMNVFDVNIWINETSSYLKQLETNTFLNFLIK